MADKKLNGHDVWSVNCFSAVGQHVCERLVFRSEAACDELRVVLQNSLRESLECVVYRIEKDEH